MNAKTMNEDQLFGRDMKDKDFHTANYFLASFNPPNPPFGDSFTAEQVRYHIKESETSGTYRQTIGRILSPALQITVNIPSNMNPGTYPVSKWDSEKSPTTCMIAFIADGSIYRDVSGEITFDVNEQEKVLSATFEVNFNSSVVSGSFSMAVN
ncbi:hypothetical protein [Pseudomonas sp. NPDC089534]|uniref:hypothetical protein n=1 Tax=Pseudomonas sp. NPDC089534 TaxID=3364468 RepID=UPI00380AA4EA